MYTIQPKKLLIINILDILQKYSDADHRLSQRNIEDILKREYHMTADRKAVKRNLMNLIDFGYRIEYSESVRMVPNSKTGELEESYILSDFYLVRDFDDSELRLLIDSLLFSKHIPYSQCKALIEKLEGLSNVYFKAKVRHIRTMPQNLPENKELFYTIEVLDEAISKGKMVSFRYHEYKTDKRLHPRCNKDGKATIYKVTPYQMAANNGRYYLICNRKYFDGISDYRIDRIAGITLLDEPARPLKEVTGADTLDLPRHMAENIYMFAKDGVRVRFLAKKYILNDIIDWFGKDAAFSEEKDDEVTVTVQVNEQAMFYWAMQYGEHIEILEPDRLREKIGEAAKEICEKYRKWGK